MLHSVLMGCVVSQLKDYILNIFMILSIHKNLFTIKLYSRPSNYLIYIIVSLLFIAHQNTSNGVPDDSSNRSDQTVPCKLFIKCYMYACS